MTINQYLCLLEVLKIKRERAFEKYIRLQNKATSPAAAYINPDGIPKSRSYANTREDILIKAADAWSDYLKAFDAYYSHYEEFEKNLDKLELGECWALRQIYIDNMGKPPERRRAGVCRRCCVRTKAEAAVLISQAKRHLTEILRAQGIDIE